MKISMILALGLILILASVPGCIKKDPKADTIIADVRNAVSKDFSEDLSKVTEMKMFENTLKVYMTDDYPPEKVKSFLTQITKAYGESMRKNKKLSSSYWVQMFQNRKVEDKMKMRQIADSIMENSTDRIKITEYGAEGK